MPKQNKTWMYAAVGLIVILAAAFYLGYITIDTTNPNPITNPTPTPTTPSVITGGDMVSATKQLKIVAVDELAGGALDGTTNAIKVYDSDGKTLLETCSLSSGSCTTANTYGTGRTLWILYYYDTTIDAYHFWQVSVPSMSRADAESLTTNAISVKTREAGAYTDSLITSAGITITDALEFNCTGSSNDTGTMTYSYYTTTDNTGYSSFHDPVYNIDLKMVLWAELSGTGYSTISLAGFDGAFEKGSTMYYYKVISDDAISKYKVGNDYVLPGAGSTSFSWNAVGYANTTTANPTLQITLKVYSSSSYMQQYGDYGPYDFSACENTMTFYTN